MTHEELLAAAERISRTKTEHVCDVYGINGEWVKYDSDCDSVADAYLAEHPADGAEPITLAWLHQHAVEDSGGGWVRLAADGRSLSVSFDAGGGMSIWMSDGDVSEFVPDGMRPRTRDEFRALCKAFRIPLTEPTP